MAKKNKQVSKEPTVNKKEISQKPKESKSKNEISTKPTVVKNKIKIILKFKPKTSYQRNRKWGKTRRKWCKNA